MDPVIVFGLIEKGLTLLPILINAGIDITQRVEQLQKLAKGGAEGTLTDVEIETIRAEFDADLDEFNTPMDPSTV